MTAQEQAKRLKEERARIHDEMKTIHARTDANGNLSADDDQKWLELSKQDDELEKKSARIIKLAEIEKLEAERKSRELPGQDGANDPEKKSEADRQKAYRAALMRALRVHGDQRISQADMETLEKRGTDPQSGTTDAAGGYTVPDEFGNTIERYMKLYGGMLEAGDFMPTTTGGPITNYPTINDTSNKGAYVDQGADDSVGDLTFGNVSFPVVHDITSKIVLVPWSLLQDTGIDLENLLSELLGERIGRFVNEEMTTGSTAGRIQGFISGSSSGKTAASATGFTRQELVDLMHSVNASYRNSPKCGWMFNDSTLASIKKLSFGTGDDRPLWVPSMIVGAPDTLEGKPYWINEDMASVGTGTKPVAFGDFSKYKIRRMVGINLKVTRDRYWEKSCNGYKAFARMDGRLVNDAAIKYLTMAS